jgi:hypothetical protein
LDGLAAEMIRNLSDPERRARVERERAEHEEELRKIADRIGKKAP